MALGDRTARRHETAASKAAGYDRSIYWTFQVGQRVMTVDGFPGTIKAVQDGPLMGTEAYVVVLTNGMGGGEYTVSQLTAMNEVTASEVHTADMDYPELGDILVDRPDPGLNTTAALERGPRKEKWEYGDTAAQWSPDGEHQAPDVHTTCPGCGGTGLEKDPSNSYSENGNCNRCIGRGQVYVWNGQIDGEDPTSGLNTTAGKGREDWEDGDGAHWSPDGGHEEVIYRTCNTCGGNGFMRDGYQSTCGGCGGYGTVLDEHQGSKQAARDDWEENAAKWRADGSHQDSENVCSECEYGFDEGETHCRNCHGDTDAPCVCGGGFNGEPGREASKTATEDLGFDWEHDNTAATWKADGSNQDCLNCKGLGFLDAWPWGVCKTCKGSGKGGYGWETTSSKTATEDDPFWELGAARWNPAGTHQDPDDETPCQTCDGRGSMPRESHHPSWLTTSEYDENHIECQDCNGYGSTYSGDEPPDSHQGSKTAAEDGYVHWDGEGPDSGRYVVRDNDMEHPDFEQNAEEYYGRRARSIRPICVRCNGSGRSEPTKYDKAWQIDKDGLATCRACAGIGTTRSDRDDHTAHKTAVAGECYTCLSHEHETHEHDSSEDMPHWADSAQWSPDGSHQTPEHHGYGGMADFHGQPGTQGGDHGRYLDDGHDNGVFPRLRNFDDPGVRGFGHDGATYCKDCHGPEDESCEGQCGPMHHTDEYPPLGESCTVCTGEIHQPWHQATRQDYVDHYGDDRHFSPLNHPGNTDEDNAPLQHHWSPSGARCTVCNLVGTGDDDDDPCPGGRHQGSKTAAVPNDERNVNEMTGHCAHGGHDDCEDYPDTTCLCQCHDHHGVPHPYRTEGDDQYTAEPFEGGAHPDAARHGVYPDTYSGPGSEESDHSAYCYHCLSDQHSTPEHDNHSEDWESGEDAARGPDHTGAKTAADAHEDGADIHYWTTTPRGMENHLRAEHAYQGDPEINSKEDGVEEHNRRHVDNPDHYSDSDADGNGGNGWEWDAAHYHERSSPTWDELDESDDIHRDAAKYTVYSPNGVEIGEPEESGLDEANHLTWDGCSPACKDTHEYSMFGQNDAVEKQAASFYNPCHYCGSEDHKTSEHPMPSHPRHDADFEGLFLDEMHDHLIKEHNLPDTEFSDYYQMISDHNDAHDQDEDAEIDRNADKHNTEQDKLLERRKKEQADLFGHVDEMLGGPEHDEARKFMDGNETGPTKYSVYTPADGHAHLDPESDHEGVTPDDLNVHLYSEHDYRDPFDKSKDELIAEHDRRHEDCDEHGQYWENKWESDAGHYTPEHNGSKQAVHGFEDLPVHDQTSHLRYPHQHPAWYTDDPDDMIKEHDRRHEDEGIDNHDDPYGSWMNGTFDWVAEDSDGERGPGFPSKQAVHDFEHLYDVDMTNHLYDYHEHPWVEPEECDRDEMIKEHDRRHEDEDRDDHSGHSWSYGLDVGHHHPTGEPNPFSAAKQAVHGFEDMNDERAAAHLLIHHRHQSEALDGHDEMVAEHDRRHEDEGGGENHDTSPWWGGGGAFRYTPPQPWEKGRDAEFTAAKAAFDPWAILTTAAADSDFRFQVTASWFDVRAKAKRIRATGGVHVTLSTQGMVIAEVKGDHNVYESGLQRHPGRQAIAAWSCGCKWGAYHWGAADDFSRFAGRMCSHALALQYEAQSRGMFGRDVTTDSTKPSWVPRKVVVKYDIDDAQNVAVPATKVGSLSDIATGLDSPIGRLIVHAYLTGETADETLMALSSAGIDGRIVPLIGPDNVGVKMMQRWAAVGDTWTEPSPPPKKNIPGPTKAKDPNENPVSAGWASSPDPSAWSQAAPSGISDITSSLQDDDLEYGSQAELHDEPEGALPSTDGAGDDDSWTSGPDADHQSPDPEPGGSKRPCFDCGDRGYDADLGDECQTCGGISLSGSVDIVAKFQATAGAQMLMAGGGGVGGDDGLDIAGAAKEHLAKVALKAFTPAEQYQIINEGEGTKAANLDRLDLTATHYLALEKALAAADDEDDDESWMTT